MNKVKYRLTLDLERPGIQHTIYAKRGDSLSREVAITLREGGKAYVIGDGVTAYLYAKADAAEIFAECAVSGSTITALLSTNMLDAEDIAFELRLTDGGGAVLTTPKVKVVSEDRIYSEDAITATDDFSALLAAIATANAAKIESIRADENTIVIAYAGGDEVSFEVDAVEGKPGKDGVSPTVSVKKESGVAIVSVTDASGTSTANVYDGEDGLDPYAYAVSNGFDGSESAFADMLVRLTGGATEEWVFALEDGSTVTKKVVVL